MSSRTCCVKDCGTRAGSGPTLFTVPKHDSPDHNHTFRSALEPHMKAGWRTHLKLIVCEFHFEEKYLGRRYKSNVGKKLLSGAVPTLFGKHARKICIENSNEDLASQEHSQEHSIDSSDRTEDSLAPEPEHEPPFIDFTDEILPHFQLEPEYSDLPYEEISLESNNSTDFNHETYEDEKETDFQSHPVAENVHHWKRPFISSSGDIFCCVKSCQRRGPSLYPIPKIQSAKKRKKWLDILEPFLAAEWKNRKNLFVCERHFGKEYFRDRSIFNENSLVSTIKELNVKALPVYELESNNSQNRSLQNYPDLSYYEKSKIRKSKFLKSFSETAAKVQKEDSMFFSLRLLDRRCRTCLEESTEKVKLDGSFELDSEKFSIIEELKRFDPTISKNDSKPQQICAKCFQHLKLLTSFRISCEKTRKTLDKFVSGFSSQDSTESDERFVSVAVQTEEKPPVQVEETLEDDFPEDIFDYVNDSIIPADPKVVEYLEEQILSLDLDMNLLEQTQDSQETTNSLENTELRDETEFRDNSEGKIIPEDIPNPQNDDREREESQFLNEKSNKFNNFILNMKTEHPDANALKSKKLNHHQNKFECHHCQRRFSLKCELRKHLKKIHFHHLKQDHLVNQEIIHSGERRFICSVSGKNLKNMNILKDHARSFYATFTMDPLHQRLI